VSKSLKQKFKAIHNGDTVERVTGVYEGLVGVVISRKPKRGIFATHIKVRVDLSDFSQPVQRRLRLILNKWNSVASWKRISSK
jgi:hypothetical protein